MSRRENYSKFNSSAENRRITRKGSLMRGGCFSMMLKRINGWCWKDVVTVSLELSVRQSNPCRSWRRRQPERLRWCSCATQYTCHVQHTGWPKK